MKCKYCGKKGVQLKHYAQKHQKQLQAARKRHAGKRGHSKKAPGRGRHTITKANIVSAHLVVEL